MFDGYLRRSMTGSVRLRKAAAFQRDLHPFSGSYCMQYCASGGPHGDQTLQPAKTAIT